VDELQEAAQALLAAERAAREDESRWRDADALLEEAAQKNSELLEVLGAARSAQTEADERARRMEDRLQLTIQRANAVEEMLAEAETKLQEAEAQPKLTVIVDDERDALQDALAMEVRRPLTSILGLTLALKHADPSSNDTKNMIKQLTSSARRLDRLVGQMLDLDKIAAGAYEPNRRRTDIEALVRRVVEDAPDLASRELKVEAEHVIVSVDPALTEQMVETLLMNAGRRSTSGEPVWVRVSSDQDGVVIAVDDTGSESPSGPRTDGPSGSPADDGGPVGRRNKPRGATGLSLLSRLAELHGGRAWVEDRPGGGASFRVFLPDMAEDEAAGSERRAADLASGIDDDEDDVAFDPAIAVAGLRELAGLDDF
jgi:K+-sensing histidine kinase KdpD